MKKLIKLKDHFYIVDDSEITEGDWYFLPKESVIAKCPKKLKLNSVTPEWTLKITHSTKELEGVILLNTSDIEELVYGYSWKIEFEKANLKYGAQQHSFYLGFKAHQELTKDKLFTIEDMDQAYINGINDGSDIGNKRKMREEYLKSLLPKTEWNIEIETYFTDECERLEGVRDGENIKKEYKIKLL